MLLFLKVYFLDYIYESDLPFSNSLKPKTMERRKKCEKEQMSNECNSRLDQIQLSCLNSLPISAGMFPSERSLSCSTLHHRVGTEIHFNVRSKQCYQQPQRERER